MNINYMPYFRVILILLCTVSVSACALPGLGYRAGGSTAWEDQKDSSGKAIQVEEITPALTLEMAQKAFDKHQALMSEVRAASTQPSWNYYVGVGDILSVIVWDHPELTNPAGTTTSVDSSGRIVRPDGTIFYPYAGDVLVAGKTAAEIRQLLTQKLAHAIQTPQVDVKVLQYRSQLVTVVGDTDQPCKFPITDVPMYIVDAIGQCKTGGLVSGAAAGDNSLSAHRDIDLVRGTDRRTADLYAVYKGHDPLSSELLQGGDVVYLQDSRWNRIFVVGEVARQAALYIPVSGLTLADALNGPDVGGLNQQTADARNIYVFRGGLNQAELKSGKVESGTVQPLIFHLNAKSADALLLADQFQLQPRDVVFASAAPLVSYSRTAALILPTISELIQTSFLIRAVR